MKRRLLLAIGLMGSSILLWIVLIALRWEYFVEVTFPEPRGEAIWAYDPLGFWTISILCGILFLGGLSLLREIASLNQRSQNW